MSAAKLLAVVTVIYLFAFSTYVDGSDATVLARGSGSSRPQQPQIAVDESGTVHLVYGVGDTVNYQKSPDNGGSFAEPTPLSFAKTMSLGMRRGPRVVAHAKSVCITAIGGQQGKGRDGDLLAMHSSDGGQSWDGPVQVNDVDGSAREGLHAMAIGSQGQICCVWLDLRNKRTEIMAAKSQDGGATWSKNVLVYASPDGSVCECCHPSAVFDDKGALHVQFRNSLAGKRDMYLISSKDGGTTFGKATKLGEGTWPLGACPMDGGAVAVSDKQSFSAWRRDKTIYLTGTGNAKERRVGEGEQPTVAATAKGPVVAWLSKRGGALNVLLPGKSNATEVASSASDPAIAVGTKGKGPVILAWEEAHGKDASIVCQVLSSK